MDLLTVSMARIKSFFIDPSSSIDSSSEQTFAALAEAHAGPDLVGTE